MAVCEGRNLHLREMCVGHYLSILKVSTHWNMIFRYWHTSKVIYLNDKCKIQLSICGTIFFCHLSLCYIYAGYDYLLEFWNFTCIESPWLLGVTDVLVDTCTITNKNDDQLYMFLETQYQVLHS